MEQHNQIHPQAADDLAMQDEQADSDVSSEHSDHPIPDLNVQVIYEIEIAEQPDDPEPIVDPLNLNDEPETSNDLVLALPAPPPINFLGEEIDMEQLMDVAMNNVDDILQEPLQMQAMEQDGNVPQMQVQEQDNLNLHDPQFIGFV